MDIFGEHPRYGCFRYYAHRLILRGYRRLSFGDVVRAADLKATSRKLGPRLPRLRPL